MSILWFGVHLSLFRLALRPVRLPHTRWKRRCVLHIFVGFPHTNMRNHWCVFNVFLSKVMENRIRIPFWWSEYFWMLMTSTVRKHLGSWLLQVACDRGGATQKWWHHCHAVFETRFMLVWIRLVFNVKLLNWGQCGSKLSVFRGLRPLLIPRRAHTHWFPWRWSHVWDRVRSLDLQYELFARVPVKHALLWVILAK